ncbi:MAG TPA: hypothetical protein DEA08_27460 [Planctomycetes bacterium]|nr:hypothetical protein [Planctomycetota bacterium]
MALGAGSALAPGGTLDGERGGDQAVALEGSREGTVLAIEQASERSRPLAELLDVEVLSGEHQAALSDARVTRVAIRLGLIDWDQAAEAWASEQAAADWLTAEGLLDPFRAMEVFAEANTLRNVCPLTLRLLEEPAEGTVAQGSGGNQSIEGFPGVGGTFAGHEILARVAEGAMGVVFRARQIKLNRVVALKVMRGGALASKTRKKRFLNEAEAAAALTHPAIVPVHEIGEVNGYPFYTMDYIEGSTLDVHVREGQSDPREVARLTQVLAEGVQHFHQHGILHRDLKPENVLVAEDGPKIIDFGIAKRLGEESGAGTVDGALIGTPQYMAPEQAAGRVREVDIRTDVYAMGVIAYELLSGRLPFQGTHAAVVMAIQSRDPDSLRSIAPHLDRDLVAIVEMAMAKEPERRYQSAAELAQDLERYQADLPVVARPATWRYRLRKAVRRNKATVIAASVCLLVLSGSGGWVLYRRAEAHAQVVGLIEQAGQESLPLDEREELLTQALTLDPDNLAAGAQRQALREQRAAEQRLADQEARLREQTAQLEAADALRKAREAEAKLAQERAQREAQALKEREQARLDAARRAQAAAEERARQLLARSRAESDPLEAIGHVSDALVLLPAGASEVRRELETHKLSLALRLADTAIEGEAVDMGRFWLREARKLGIAAVVTEVRAEIAARDARLQRLLTGEGHLQEAKALLRRGDLLGARERLALARAQGLDEETLAAEGRVIETRCRERGQELLDEGQQALAAGDLAQALNRAVRALEYLPGSAPAEALATSAEQRLIDRSRREAARLFRGTEGRSAALSLLERAEGALRESAAAELARDRRAWAALAKRELAGLVYLPQVRDHAGGGVYLQQTEVTNEAFAAFVQAGGYGDDRFWDSGAQAAAVREQGAPRSWREGSYGDQSNAERPVRGVSVYEARAYARWLSRERGGRWRLPREAEWTLAASWDPARERARVYPWGDAFGEWGGASQQPPEVGQDESDRSALGVQGLGRGVMEWVELPSGPGTKGACWAAPRHLAERYARVAVSGTPGAQPPAELAGWIGFRLVREVTE